MASWRDSASQQTQEDLDDLLGSTLDLAQHQLRTRGEFYPFAMTVNTSGERETVAVDIPNDHPMSSEVITTLIKS